MANLLKALVSSPTPFSREQLVATYENEGQEFAQPRNSSNKRILIEEEKENPFTMLKKRLTTESIGIGGGSKRAYSIPKINNDFETQDTLDFKVRAEKLKYEPLNLNSSKSKNVEEAKCRFLTVPNSSYKKATLMNGDDLYFEYHAIKRIQDGASKVLNSNFVDH